MILKKNCFNFSKRKKIFRFLKIKLFLILFSLWNSLCLKDRADIFRTKCWSRFVIKTVFELNFLSVKPNFRAGVGVGEVRSEKCDSQDRILFRETHQSTTSSRCPAPAGSLSWCWRWLRTSWRRRRRRGWPVSPSAVTSPPTPPSVLLEPDSWWDLQYWAPQVSQI